MIISVIVPTYRRVADLDRCLTALRNQRRAADEVLVVVRDSDETTRQFLAGRSETLPVTVVTVSTPGVVAAMNAGLAAARGDVIALTDDDAAPWPDWLARIEAWFAADPQLGGVGGRDWVYKAGKLDDGQVSNAGQISWFGRVTAGHHHAVGAPAEVWVLKGVNCAYRAAPLRQIGFDTRMAGTGAQVHWELSLGLAMRRAGWKLILDPAIGVDHFPAVRFDEDQRAAFSSLAQQNAVSNETLVLFEHLRGPTRAAFLAWAALVGTRAAPGVVQVPRLLLVRESHVIRRWWATARGRVAGLRAYRAAPHARPDELPKNVSAPASGVSL
jgi:GT2 family glycosyltransferase